MFKIKRIGIIIILITICLYINVLKFNANDIENDNVVIEEKVYINSDLEMAYLIYLPKGYNINNKYRLVLFMHGAGDRGFDYDILHKTVLSVALSVRRRNKILELAVLAGSWLIGGWFWLHALENSLIDQQQSYWTLAKDCIVCTKKDHYSKYFVSIQSTLVKTETERQGK